MIISASRRTDIPRFYFDWLTNRLAEGYVLVRNPMNYRQVSRVSLSPQVVDCIVLWTKDPSPMRGRLDALAPFPYYVQFTVNPYGADMETGLPEKETLLDTFAELAAILGPQCVVWRYSPVLFTERYTEQYHLASFRRFAQRLEGSTLQCKLSFLDIYAKIKKRMSAMGVHEGAPDVQAALAHTFMEIAAAHGISLSACGSTALADAGIPPARCIDDKLIEAITGQRLHTKKDPGQRDVCYCVESVDIGAYDSCLNGCKYCYANLSDKTARRNMQCKYDPQSPMLLGNLEPGDKITERAMKSLIDPQVSMF